MFQSQLYRILTISFPAVTLLFLFNSFNYSRGGNFQYGQDTLLGHVKTETYFHYEYNKNADAPDSNWTYKSISNYNRTGQVESEFYYNSQNKIDSGMTLFIKYDAKGRELSWRNLNGTISDSKIYSIDKNGNDIQVILFDANFSGSKWVSDKKKMVDTFYSYHRNGNLALNIIQIKDKNGDIIEERHYNNSGDIIETETRTYDDHHNKLTEIRTDNNGEKHSHFFEYDKFGNEIFEKVVNDIYIGGWRVGEFDTTNKDITYYRLRYSDFDKHNNWQKEESLFKGKAVKKIIRKLEYYD